MVSLRVDKHGWEEGLSKGERRLTRQQEKAICTRFGTYQELIHIRPYFKHSTYVISFLLTAIQWGWIVLFTVYRSGKERLSNIPRVTQLIVGGRNQICIWLQGSILNHSAAPASCCHRLDPAGLARENKWLSRVGKGEPSNAAIECNTVRVVL